MSYAESYTVHYEDKLYNWAKARADAFEAQVASCLNDPSLVKDFAYTLATAKQDSDTLPDCINAESIDADCYMYINRNPYGLNREWLRHEKERIESAYYESTEPSWDD